MGYGVHPVFIKNSKIFIYPELGLTAYVQMWSIVDSAELSSLASSTVARVKLQAHHTESWSEHHTAYLGKLRTNSPAAQYVPWLNGFSEGCPELINQTYCLLFYLTCKAASGTALMRPIHVKRWCKTCGAAKISREIVDEIVSLQAINYHAFYLSSPLMLCAGPQLVIGAYIINWKNAGNTFCVMEFNHTEIWLIRWEKHKASFFIK